ncbi:YqhA family protein [Moraxella sp. CTOTU49803]|jgi:uncharacterized membrane protein YqhA|nr:YqhA family protein [Moraxella sp. CTOTU49803]
MIEKLFKNSRYLVFLTIMVSLVSSVTLYMASLNIIFHILSDFFTNPTVKPLDGQILAVNLLKTLDILLIALSFQMIAIANYRLFISNKPAQESRFLTVLGIKDFHDLKINLMQVSMIILVILFLEQAVEGGANINTFLYGASIAMVVIAMVWAIKSLRH